MNSNNSFALKFRFADPINDPFNLQRGVIDNIRIVRNSAIEDALGLSGVDDVSGSKLLYAWNESRGGQGRSSRMDFMITGESVSFDGESSGIFANTLYLTHTKSGSYAHNNHNCGNFLWGAAMKRLGINHSTASFGAHLDALKNEGEWDSEDDQRSIRLGYEYD